LNSGFYLSDLTADEGKLLKICLGDADGVTSNDVEVYKWDFGSFTEYMDTDIYVMDSYPHAIKLVKVDPYDDFDGGYYYLTWWSPETSETGKFYLANAPSSGTYSGGYTYAVYTTDGIVERVILDEYSDGEITQFSSNPTKIGPPGADARVTAYFTQFSNILYTSYDVSCETGFSMVEPCLDKGDMLFIIDSAYMNGGYSPTDAAQTADMISPPTQQYVETGDLYTIKKIYKEKTSPTTFAREDRFRIIVDKNIPWDGSELADRFAFAAASENSTTTGIVQLFKFTPATTGNYEYVSQCSNRGTCDTETTYCDCFRGYTGDDCSVVNALAI
jgi:hypothetical protein